VIQAIGLKRLRAIKNVVLVAQLVGNIFERLIQIFQLKGKKAWPPVSSPDSAGPYRLPYRPA